MPRMSPPHDPPHESAEMVWVWEVASDSAWMNDTLRGHFGFPDNHIAQALAFWKERIHPADQPRVIRRFRETRDEKRTYWADQYRVLCADGKYLRVLSHGYLFYADAELLRVIGVNVDLDRQRELEEFTAVISHELKEPLRLIASYANLLGNRYRNRLDSDADAFLGDIVRGAQRATRLVDDLLGYARTRGARKRDVVPLTSALQEAVANLRLAIEDADATVSATELPTVRADRAQLIVVFQNLIDNALRYRGKEPPHIRIECRPCREGHCFSVTDNGIGLGAEQLERLCLRSRGITLEEESPGTGLGLAICKRIIERHGGKLWAESSPELGSTFYFILPNDPATQG